MLFQLNLRTYFLISVILVFLPHIGCSLEFDQTTKVSDWVYSSLRDSLETCFSENKNETQSFVEEIGIIIRVFESNSGYQATISICKTASGLKAEDLFSKKSKFGVCLSKEYIVKIKEHISANRELKLRTSFRHVDEVIKEEDLNVLEKKDIDGKVIEVKRGFKFNTQNESKNTIVKKELISADKINTYEVGTTKQPQSIEINENKDVNVEEVDVILGELCKELSPDEFVDAVRFQNTFFFPDAIYLELAILLRRIVKRMELKRSAEESLSIILPGIGGLVVSDARCEETMRISLVSGELATPGVGSNDFPVLCRKLQKCISEKNFHESVLIALTKSKRYVEFVLRRNRNYMWEILTKMSGILGNINGLKAYQLWMELEILIKHVSPEEDVLHSDLPKEMILLTELINDSKSPTVECTISLMKIGTSYEIRLSQVSEVARICNRIVSDSSNFLSSDELRLISDTTILSRISDWIVGTFILEKHIPPGVTRPAACMYLSAITSPMDYSTLTNFLWPRVVFAIASSSSSALSFTTRSVDPENCRKALEKIIKKIGDKLQLNIDETCGKMANCILNGRLGRINVDDTINNALSQSTQALNNDPGINSASLRLARFIFESKAPTKSKKNGFSKLSAPLRGSVLFGHLQAIMPGGFSINDIVKFVHEFTRESPPYGPVKKCFKVLLKYIPVFVATDKEVKSICIDAFGPWIMPDVLVSDVLLSQNNAAYDYII